MCLEMFTAPSRRRIAPWVWLHWGRCHPQLFFFWGGCSLFEVLGVSKKGKLLIRWKHQSLHEMVGKVEGDPCRCPTRPTLVLHDGEQPKSQSLELVFTDLSVFCASSPGEPEPNLLHADALQRLVVLSHGHGQECGFVPDVKPPAPGSASQLVWECVAGHSFSWGVPGAVGNRTPTTVHHGEEQQEDSGCSSPPVTGCRRSLRRAGLVTESGSGKGEAESEGAARSPIGDGDRREEPGAGSRGGDDGNAGELLCVPFSILISPSSSSLLCLSQRPSSTSSTSTYRNSCCLLAAPQVPMETGTTAKDHGR